MSTDDDLLQMPRPRRRVVPPNDPSEDELARDWDLTAADLTEINRCQKVLQGRPGFVLSVQNSGG